MTKSEEPQANIDSLRNEIAAIYEWNAVGGPLHIVLDDGNVDDADIRFCLGTLTKHWSIVEDKDNANEVLSLACSIGYRLLQLSVDERRALFEKRWKP